MCLWGASSIVGTEAAVMDRNEFWLRRMSPNYHGPLCLKLLLILSGLMAPSFFRSVLLGVWGDASRRTQLSLWACVYMSSVPGGTPAWHGGVSEVGDLRAPTSFSGYGGQRTSL